MTDARRRRRRRWPLVLAASLATVIVLLVAGDALARGYAEQRLEVELAQRLPEGSGSAEVSIGGLSFVQQYLSGRFEEVTVDVPELALGPATVAAAFAGHGVPTARGEAVERIEGVISLDEEALGALVAPVGATSALRLGEGELHYDGTISIFGLEVDFEMTLVPTVDGDTVLLTPVEVTAGEYEAVDVDALFANLDDFALPFCAAALLPEGVAISDVVVTEGAVRIAIEATGLPLTAETLTRTGSCD